MNSQFQDPNQYQTIFRILDTLSAACDFVRMLPWHIWYLLSYAYILTIYRLYWHIRYKLFLKSL